MEQEQQYCYIETRVCYRCKKEQHRSHFYKDRSDKYGLQAACKECTKKRLQEYNINHPDYFKKKGKDKYASIDDKPSYNKKRYADAREQYISRHRAYLQTTNGRFNTLLYSAKARAKNKGLPYNLTLEWLLDTYEKQNKVCLLTGLPFDFSHN